MLSPHRPKRLLITGGRGRLAPLLADHFGAPYFSTSLYSRKSSQGLAPLHALLNPQHFAAGDSILHLAWSTLPATSEMSPGSEESNDLPWLERLLAAMVSIPADSRPHLIFFSSGGAVYGNAPDRANRESDECRPLGNYGRAKLAAERLIIEATDSSGLDAAILRISNPYGYPVPRARRQGIIPHAIRSAVEQCPLSLWGNGEARKDFIYYTDFLNALRHIVEQRLSGIFNVCSGQSHRISEIIALVEKHTHRPITVQSTIAPPWDVQDSRLDPSKLVMSTGWSPQVELEEGIRRSVAAYLDH